MSRAQQLVMRLNVSTKVFVRSSGRGGNKEIGGGGCSMQVFHNTVVTSAYKKSLSQPVTSKRTPASYHTWEEQKVAE